MSFDAPNRKNTGKKSGFTRSNLPPRHEAETWSASVDLEDIIERYDGNSRKSNISLASKLNTNPLSQSYFSLYETPKEDETTSFYSALQDGFSLNQFQCGRRFPKDPISGREGQELLWEDEDDQYCSGERNTMLQQSNFQVFWHNLVYKIEPKLTLGGFWSDLEQSVKSRLSYASELISCRKSRSYEVGDQSSDSVSSKSCERESLTIIQQISGSFKSGELTAVMGPSGAGKTSLLNFLSRRQEDGYTGQLYVDNSYRRVKISTIPQHDHLPQYLTVRENLLFASRLKNPQKNYDHERNVEKVSNLLGLDSFLETRTNKISGGQHKRLAIAQELLSKPDILILDEPTSGLDSLTCYKTLAVLKNLVKSSSRKLMDPIAIVLTIHQPQQDVFDIFDKVYVMATGGIVIYDGPPDKSVQFIEKYSGIKIPDKDYNPASFLIEIASGEYGIEPIKALESQVKLEFEMNREELTHKMALKSATSHMRSSAEDLVIDKTFRKSFTGNNKQNHPLNGTNATKTNEKSSRQKPVLYMDQRIAKGSSMNKGSFWTKTCALMGRYWISVIRDPKQMLARITFHLMLPIFLFLIMGSEPGRSNACPRFKSQYELKDLVNNDSFTNDSVQEEMFLSLENLALMFTMIYALVSANIGSLTLSFTLDMQSSLKEYHNGWYSMSSYLIARMLTDIPMEICLPILTLALGYPLTGQMTGGHGISDMYRVLTTALAIILGSMVGNTIGMIFGAIYIGHLSTALFAGQGATLPLVFLSGFVVRIKNMSKFVYGLSYFSFYRHSLEITMIARYGFNVCSCDPASISGRDAELVGVTDKLRDFAKYWLNSLSQSSGDEETEVATSTVAALIGLQTTPFPGNSTTILDTKDDVEQDIFGMFAKQVSLYNTYGTEVKSCRDVVPYILTDFSLDESDLPIAFIALALLMIFSKVVLFLVVKVMVRLRTSL